MRENMGLYRGKRRDTGEWVEGYLGQDTLIGDKKTWLGYVIKPIPKKLWDAEWFEVDPSTVGQFTGLPDKDGKRIFEWDVVRYGNKTGYVIYENGCFCVQDSTTQNRPAIDLVMDQWDVTVIGTIHDSPELLEVTPDE